MRRAHMLKAAVLCLVAFAAAYAVGGGLGLGIVLGGLVAAVWVLW